MVCVTKSYDLNDFELWYNWHCNLGIDKIHIFDNESYVSIYEKIKREDTYTKIDGWPNQWKIYETVLNENIFSFDNNDYVFFIDDDEFIWYDNKKYSSLKTELETEFTELDCVLMPQILMSTKHLEKTRKKDLIHNSIYRRNDFSNQGKCIIQYNPEAKYKFTKSRDPEQGHVPWINGIRLSKVVGSGCSKTTYGIVKYDADLRLYHYHIKSLDDWNKKINRGSAAVSHQWYNTDITKNIHYGNYSVVDMTMYNAL